MRRIEGREKSQRNQPLAMRAMSMEGFDFGFGFGLGFGIAVDVVVIARNDDALQSVSSSQQSDWPI